MFVAQQPDKNSTRYKLDHRIPVAQEEIDFMYDQISRDLFPDKEPEIKEKAAEALTSFTPFIAKEFDPAKDGGSKFEAVDKLKEKSELDAESKKTEIEEAVQLFNTRIEEALDLEKKIKQLGEDLGKTKDEVIAAIVDEEDRWYEPGPSLARNRQLNHIIEISKGDGRVKEIQAQYDENLGKLDSVGEIIEAVREKIRSSFEQLINSSKNKDELLDLQKFLDELDIKEDELQILQRNEVEARYKSLKEGLGADCVAAIVRITKSMAAASKQEGDTLNTSSEKTEKTSAEVKPQVGFETFSPIKPPVIEKDLVSEESEFGSQDTKLPGVVEGSIERQQQIDKIRSSLSKPVEIPTPPSQEKMTPQEGDITVITDSNGAKLEVDYDNPKDGAGVEINTPQKVAPEEQTIPTYPEPVEDSIAVSPEPVTTSKSPQPELPVTAPAENAGSAPVSKPIQTEEKPRKPWWTFGGLFGKRDEEIDDSQAAFKINQGLVSDRKSEETKTE